jgi:hypothetical protein
MNIRKVLLVEDYSSFHLNLRDGLRELGIDAKVASSGDIYKNFTRDIDLSFNRSGNRFINYYRQAKTYFSGWKHFSKNDVVQLITPRILYGKWSDNFFFNHLKKNNSKIFYAACAADVTYFEGYRNGVTEKYGYSIQEGMLRDFNISDKSGKKILWEDDDFKKEEKKYLERFDGIIPVLWDYYISYQSVNQKKLKSLIPLPINCNNLIYQENIVRGKVKIFHGVSANREYFKGSYTILDALKKMEEKYPNDINVVTVKNVSNREYVDTLSSSNVLIDQVNSYDLGMAALQGLALGKVVLTGAEPDALKAKGLNKVPYFNALPNVDQICSIIEFLIENKDQIPTIGYQSRQFAEENHGHIKIAQKYLDVWNAA